MLNPTERDLPENGKSHEEISTSMVALGVHFDCSNRA
jgi:hypothetical protein